MGNTLAPLDPRKTKKFDAFLAKYPKLLNRELLSDNKLFKTYSFLVEGESSIIMKVYLKRDSTYLRKHEVSLNYMQKTFNLNLYPNLLPYTKLIDELDFAALVRQKCALTLSHRLQTIPTLKTIEKLWIIFQLLTGLYNLHQLGLYHGAISSNNILLTNWHHVFYADFAWYAPNYVYDTFEELNYYYPSASKKCNLAPEKFIPRDSKDTGSLQWTHENINQVSPETMANLKKMDVFSLGCVIAEIMLDGPSLFTYEQLLAYRRGNYSPQDKLDKIKDERIRSIVTDMIQKDPANRRDILDILRQWATEIVPLSFSQLIYHINSSLISQNFIIPDQRIALIRELLEPIYTNVIKHPLKPHYEPLPIVIQQDQTLQHFLRYYQTIKPNFATLFNMEKFKLFEKEPLLIEKLEARENIDAKEMRVLMTLNHHVREKKKDFEVLLDKYKKDENGELLLIALMICSSIRNVRYLSSLLVGLEILMNFSYFLPDQINLHFIIPYLLRLLDEQNPKIVVSTFHVICEILSKMTKPIQFKSDKQLFEDQIFPNLLKAYTLNDAETKSAFVSRMPEIIKIGALFITENFIFDYQIKKNQVQPQDEVQNIPGDVQAREIDEAAVLESQGESEIKLKKEIAKEVEKWKLSFIPYIQEVFSSHHQEVNEAMLRSFAKLGESLGPEITENFLIPHLIAALNDNRFKLISLEEIEKLIDFLSERTINGLLKPVLEKCMFDSDEMNVFQSVKNLNKTVKLKKLDLKDTSFLIRNFLPLTIHPNSWIREQVLELFCGVLDQLDVLDLYANLQPALLKYVKKYEDLALLNAQLFRLVVVDPISRRVFEELRTKGTFASIKEAQIIDLCAILNEHFFGNITHEMDFEMKKNMAKPMKKSVDPKVIKNIEDVIIEFCTQSNSKHIKEVTQFENNSKLPETILVEADRDRNNPFSLEVRSDQLKTITHIRELRNQLSFNIPKFLTQHGIAYATYVKNVHYFHLFSANLLRRRQQLQKKKDKDMGYYERFERVTHLNKEWEPQGFLVKTIYEHNESVNCLDISRNSKVFASASDGGEIKIFDIAKLESDFTCNSIYTLNIKNEKNQEEFGNRSKIKALKFLDDDSFVFGTSTGMIELHTLQEASGDKEKSKSKKPQLIRQWEVDGEVKGIQPLVLGDNINEKSFIYVTHKGQLGIQDLNEKNVSVKFNIGKERGMITTMLTSALDYTVLIGTQRGYVLLYDLRANLLTSIYQLSSEAPILSFANYHPLNFGTPVTSQESLVGVSFGSDYHEVGFWNFSDFNKVAKNPEMYLYSSSNPGSECNPNYLKDFTNSESIFNIKNSFSERKYYDYLAINSPMYNVLSYFGDSINHNQEMQREKWLSHSKNIYSHISKSFQYRNSAHKVICLPNFTPGQLRNRILPGKELQNIVVTAGNDMNVRYWNLSTDKFYHIYNVDGKKRNYNSTNTNILVYQEVLSVDPEKTGFSSYQNKNGYSLNLNNTTEKNILSQAGHKDIINDAVVVEKNEMLITCSRDKTIKIWK